MTPHPELAESWEFGPDKSYLDLKLRQNVVFHDGKEFTAKDVVYNVERTLDPEIGSQLATVMKNVTAKELDPYTVRLEFAEPVPAIFDILDRLFIVDEATIDKINTQPNGTGPFKLDDWSPNDVAHLSRNENYWKPDLPKLDGIEITVLADVPTMLLNLESDNIDFMVQVPNQDHEFIRENPDLKLELSDNFALQYDILFNTANPPFDDPKVRQAFSYAMDRERFVETILFGAGKAKSSAWPPSSWAYDEELDNRYTLDLDKTKQLLDEAGFDYDTEVHMLTTSKIFPDLAKFSQILQSDLAKIGVTMEIEDAETAGWTALVLDGAWPGMTTHAFAFAQKDPSLLFAALPFQPTTGITNFRDDRYTELVFAGASEIDEDKRVEIYQEITQIMADEQFIAVLTPALGSWAMQDNVNGFKYTTDDLLIFEDVSID